jgi:hypothetical protein
VPLTPRLRIDDTLSLKQAIIGGLMSAVPPRAAFQPHQTSKAREERPTAGLRVEFYAARRREKKSPTLFSTSRAAAASVRSTPISLRIESALLTLAFCTAAISSVTRAVVDVALCMLSAIWQVVDACFSTDGVANLPRAAMRPNPPHRRYTLYKSSALRLPA